MKPIPAVTIVSNNYLALARVFAESYLEHHPGARVLACIVDTPHPAVPYSRMPFETIFAHELEIPSFLSFAFRYDILELNTAVKPYLLSFLRDHHHLDRVFYFDPDILVCDRLDDLAATLDEHDAVLTPHITEPLEDRRLPSERSILQAGVYNLGFLGIRLDRRTAELIDWWERRLHHHCLVDPPSGLFVDQSWMSLAPSFLDSVRIERDPAYNIAYWNLAHRRIEAETEPWLVNGSQIKFFHFSGIDFENLEVVSRHQDRLTLGERPDVRPCFEHYRELVYAAGWDLFRDLPYGYAKFRGTDVDVPQTARRVLQRVDPDGHRWPDPFAAEAPDSYYRWLVEPLELQKGALTRFALSLWEDRWDLKSAFPGVARESLPDFVRWIEEERDKGELPPQFFEHVSARRLPEYDHHAFEQLLSLAHLDELAGLVEWLNEPAPEAARPDPVITRLAMILHGIRDDLQIAFPDPLGRHQMQYAQWFVTSGRQDYRLPPVLVEPTRSTVPPEVLERASTYRSEKALGITRDLVVRRESFGLESWLNRPASDGDGKRPIITRLAMWIYGMRPDLREAFPDPLGDDRVHLARWFVNEGRQDFDLASALVEPVRESIEPDVGAGARAPAAAGGERAPGSEASAPSSVAADPALAPNPAPERRRREGRECIRGVNLGGYFGVGSGIGQMSRSTAAVLDRAEVPFVRLPFDEALSEKIIRDTVHQIEGLPYPVTLLNTNADETPNVLATMPLAVKLNSYKIGFWYWELSHFPLAYADRFSMLDEIWTASRFCQESIEAISTIPVHLVPPFAPPPIPAAASKSEFGLDEDRFVFFYAFDAGSIPERKNPEAAIEAIRRLQPEAPRPVALLLKISRARFDPELMPRLREMSQGLPIAFYTGTARRETVDRMLSSCDAILSLHRSEGLGLLPIEGLYLEKPVVCTAYGGVTDFLDEETGFPVEYKLKSLERDYLPYPRGSVWADPDVDHAVTRMLEVLENPDEAARRAATGRRRVEERYGLEAAARRCTTELRRIFDSLDARRSS